MSVLIKKNMIIMTRGDTLSVKINIVNVNENNQHVPYIPSDEDKIRFALKKDYSDPEPLIVKDIPIDTMTLRLESEETKKLDNQGEYVYDIQITLPDGFVDTFIKGKLKTTEEVI